jgi:hypothetical protein
MVCMTTAATANAVAMMRLTAAEIVETLSPSARACFLVHICNHVVRLLTVRSASVWAISFDTEGARVDDGDTAVTVVSCDRSCHQRWRATSAGKSCSHRSSVVMCSASLVEMDE